MEKYKRADVVGIERENERDENYKSTKNPQIDKSRTYLNYHTLPYEKKYLSFIDERIKQLSPKRKIKDDAVLITSFVLGSDKDFFDRITAEQQNQFFVDCTDFFSERYGKENVVSAVVHLDESTPHLHLNLMPVTDGRLCAKELFDRAAKRRACISQAPVKEPFLIFLKNSTSVNPIAVEKFRDLCYNINMMQTEHKMMVIDWNICFRIQT